MTLLRVRARRSEVLCADGSTQSGELCTLPMYDADRLIPRGKLGGHPHKPNRGGMTMYDVTLRLALPGQNDAERAKSPLAGLLREVAAARPDAEALVEVRQDGQKGAAGPMPNCWTMPSGWRWRSPPGLRPANGWSVWSPNSPEWVLMEYACALSGLVLVTANPAFQARELAYVLEQSGAVALFLVEEFRGNPMGRIGAEVAASIPSVREVTDMESDALYAEGLRPLLCPMSPRATPR